MSTSPDVRAGRRAAPTRRPVRKRQLDRRREPIEAKRPLLHALDYVITRVEHMADAAGDVALVTGGAAVRDGTSNTIFFAEEHPAALSCDDVNRDGLAGISVLQFSLRDSRSGAVVPVAVIPHDGELDRAGEEPATVVIGGLALTTSVRVSECMRRRARSNRSPAGRRGRRDGRERHGTCAKRHAGGGELLPRIEVEIALELPRRFQVLRAPDLQLNCRPARPASRTPLPAPGSGSTSGWAAPAASNTRRISSGFDSARRRT